MNKPLIHTSMMIQQLHENSINVDTSSTSALILPPIYSQLVSPNNNTNTTIIPETSLHHQQDGNVTHNNTHSNTTIQIESKMEQTPNHHLPNKKRKAKVLSSKSTCLEKGYEISTTQTTQTTSKKRKSNSTITSSHESSSSSTTPLMTSSTDSTSLDSNSPSADTTMNANTINTTQTTTTSKKSKKQNLWREGLQEDDFKTLRKFSRSLSELECKKEDIQNSLDELSGFKIDFLKALIISGRRKIPKFLSRAKTHYIKAVLLTEFILEKSETLKLIKLLCDEHDQTNEEEDSNNSTINNTIESIHDSNTTNNEHTDSNDNNNSTVLAVDIHTVTNLLEQNTTSSQQIETISMMLNPIISINETTIIQSHELECLSYTDPTLNVIQATNIPFILESLDQSSSSCTNDTNNTHNNDDLIGQYNSIVDDSLSFSEFLDCYQDNDKKQEEINNLKKQLNEKDEEIENLNRMYQQQVYNHRNLLNIIQNFKNNLQQFELTFYQ